MAKSLNHYHDQKVECVSGIPRPTCLLGPEDHEPLHDEESVEAVRKHPFCRARDSRIGDAFDGQYISHR